MSKLNTTQKIYNEVDKISSRLVSVQNQVAVLSDKFNRIETAVYPKDGEYYSGLSRERSRLEEMERQISELVVWSRSNPACKCHGMAQIADEWDCAVHGRVKGKERPVEGGPHHANRIY